MVSTRRARRGPQGEGSAVGDVPAAIPLADTVSDVLDVPLYVPPSNASVVRTPHTMPLVVAKHRDVGDLPAPTPRNRVKDVPGRPRHAPEHAKHDEAGPGRESSPPEQALAPPDDQVVADDYAHEESGHEAAEVGRQAHIRPARREVSLHEVEGHEEEEGGDLLPGRYDHLPPDVVEVPLLVGGELGEVLRGEPHLLEVHEHVAKVHPHERVAPPGHAHDPGVGVRNEAAAGPPEHADVEHEEHPVPALNALQVYAEEQRHHAVPGHVREENWYVHHRHASDR
eukprot:CAMPEP_0175687262 /NCGR_PEP_ID=MMETSP0097-20121207/28286_1 /TAXON_ID=311494 /ORGANISM="Alexandrium monilatum, Strain CCMP3105" /LENGTH=282 /DNA_ID=CAMNT_0016994265 /DNA_START=141 /DNA_END=989 /DNA_ORIENTATION=-